jgi:hypothetical protein
MNHGIQFTLYEIQPANIDPWHELANSFNLIHANLFIGLLKSKNSDIRFTRIADNVVEFETEEDRLMFMLIWKTYNTK